MESKVPPVLECALCQSASVPTGEQAGEALAGDRFYRFECASCVPPVGRYRRYLVSWQDLIRLALFNLHWDTDGGGNCVPTTYFRMRDDICAWIDRHWDVVTPGKTRTITWNNTVASYLSQKGEYFESGMAVKGESGWWRLRGMVPPERPEGAVLCDEEGSAFVAGRKRGASAAASSEASPGRQRRQQKRSGQRRAMDGEEDEAEGAEMEDEEVNDGRGQRRRQRRPKRVQEAEEEEAEAEEHDGEEDDKPKKRRRRSANKRSGTEHGEEDNESNNDETDEQQPASPARSRKKASKPGASTQPVCVACGKAPSEISRALPGDVVSALAGEQVVVCAKCDNLLRKGHYCTICVHTYLPRTSQAMVMCIECEHWIHTKCAVVTKGILKDIKSGDATFTCQACLDAKSKRLASNKRPLANDSFDEQDEDEQVKEAIRLSMETKAKLAAEAPIRPMTESEEAEAIVKLEALATVSFKIARLLRKLKLRKIKRKLMLLPLLDVDAYVRNVINSEAELTIGAAALDSSFPLEPSKIRNRPARPKGSSRSHKEKMHSVDLRDELDRYSVNSKAALFVPPSALSLAAEQRPPPRLLSFASRLLGEQQYASALVSQDENEIISPYTFRRLKAFVRRDFCVGVPMALLPSKLAILRSINPAAELYPIDYSFLRPQHLGQVNALLEEFFWSGINMSDALDYPDFSVVVSYKRLVIGCAFMTPAAYISYVVVHPDWRNGGIATFMLYHLLQTCQGKDVTLHVSANNPAMFLYQKFGFKPEEFIVNFYDKYYDDKSLESKNAFFIRLRRR